MENWFVVVMGLGTVFVVLTLLIVLCTLMGVVCRSKPKSEPVVSPRADAQKPDAEFIAAVSAAIAEASGTDASGLRIVSVKKL